MDRFEIRIASAQEAEVIAEISRRTFYETFHMDNSEEDMQLFLTQNFTTEVIKKELKDPANTFLLVLDDSKFCGYAKVVESNPPTELAFNRTVEIARIYSTKEKVGTGVGRALMNECLSIARKRDKEVIWLGVWERNVRAIDFYKKWGFEKFGEHVFMLGNDAQTDWLMKKLL